MKYLPANLQETKDKVLIPGKLYAVDIEIDNYGDLKNLKDKEHFTREEQNDMEATLYKALKDKGHEVQFSEFILKTIHEDIVFHPIFNVTGSLDLGSSSWTEPALPKKIIRVYFRVRSITLLVMFGILVAIIVSALVISEPRVVRIFEAVNEPFTTAKDLAVGIVQEPRKILEVGILGFIPVIALMAGVGYFILRKKAV